MGKYIDLVSVVIGGSMYLCKAPAFSNLKKEDEVIVERFENGRGIVADVCTIDDDSEVLKFFATYLTFDFPLRRVLRKATYWDFKYEDEDE